MVRGLYAITPDWQDEERLLHAVSEALAGGVSVLQYRDKSDDAVKRMRCAARLKALCEQHKGLFIINDDVALAAQVDADGVHVGKHDFAVKAAREALPDKIVGVSCYNQLERAEAEIENGADYVAFGRFYPSLTKPDAVQAERELLVKTREVGIQVPVVAIGGISLDNAKPLIDAGADALAVINDLFSADDIRARAERFAALFD